MGGARCPEALGTHRQLSTLCPLGHPTGAGHARSRQQRGQRSAARGSGDRWSVGHCTPAGLHRGAPGEHLEVGGRVGVPGAPGACPLAGHRGEGENGALRGCRPGRRRRSRGGRLKWKPLPAAPLGGGPARLSVRRRTPRRRPAPWPCRLPSPVPWAAASKPRSPSPPPASGARAGVGGRGWEAGGGGRGAWLVLGPLPRRSRAPPGGDGVPGGGAAAGPPGGRRA